MAVSPQIAGYAAAWRRALWAALAFAFGGAAAAAEVAPAPKIPPARIVVDLANDRVLEARHADAPRMPASLAKLMTAYVAFNALEAGEISRETSVTVSTTAARQPPVGVGLRAGRSQPFGALLDAALVASANDAAVAVAEAVAGSEAAFVARMNMAAVELGLARTRFVNASGLPGAGQRITAREAALLARALIERHPERSAVFSQTRVEVAGRTLLATNPLLGRYPGALGLKTGFTCAAGYNLVALADSGDARVLAVGLTYRRRPSRDAQVTAMLDRGLEAARSDAVDGASLTPEPPPLTEFAPIAAAALPGCGRSGGPSVGRPTGYAAFLGAFARRSAAASAVRVAQKASEGRGSTFLNRRRRDRRWTALLHSLRAADATRVCLAARRTGRYCVRLSPTTLRARRDLWR